MKDHLGQGIALVKFTVKGGRLKRLSPFRGIRLRSQRVSRIRGPAGKMHRIPGKSNLQQ